MAIFGRKIKLPAHQTQWLNYLKLARKYDREILEETEDVEKNIRSILKTIAKVKSPEKIYAAKGSPWLERGKGSETIHVDIEEDIRKVQKIKKLMLHRHRVISLLDDNIELYNNSMKIPNNYVAIVKQLFNESKNELENFDRKIGFVVRKLPDLENYFDNLKKTLIKIYDRLHAEEREEIRIIRIEKRLEKMLDEYAS